MDPSPLFEPLHSGHSIEQAAFVVQFSSGLDNQRLKALDKLASEKFAADFPKRTQIQSIIFGIGAAPQMLPPGAAPSGFIYQRFLENGNVATELRAEQAGVAFRTTQYTRWSDVWGKAESVSRVFAVYDTGEPNNASHAEICLARPLADPGEENEARALIWKTFGAGSFDAAKQYREGAVAKSASLAPHQIS